MYASIQGSLIQIFPAYVVVEAFGIGYKVFIPPTHLSKLPQTGEKVFLHLSYVIREFSQALYGFFDKDERDLFEVFLQASGIGPKIALSLIGHLTKEELNCAFLNGDAKRIQAVPGLGKKLSEKMILELKDKFKPSAFGNAESFFSVSNSSCKDRDAVAALVHLGYQELAAMRAVEKTKAFLGEGDLSSLIKESLKNLSPSKGRAD